MRTNSEPTALHVIAKKHFGGIAGLARACGLTANTVFRAARGERVSDSTQRRIRKAIRGGLSFAELQKPITEIVMQSMSRRRRDALVARFKIAPEHLTPAKYSERSDIREGAAAKSKSSDISAWPKRSRDRTERKS
jgi:hypothetical protein